MTKAAASFRGFKSSSPAASRAKSANPASRTKCELLLAKEFRKLGLRFLTNVIALPGKPDIVFTKARLAVFVDGDFWHGRNWTARKAKLRKGSNADYWIKKIEGNIARDRRNRAALRRTGWRVIRIWETAVHRDTAASIKKIISLLPF